MAYRIIYGMDEPVLTAKTGTPWKAQALVAVGLLVSLLLLKQFVPESAEVFSAAFIPQEGTAAYTMAEILSEGGSVRDGLILVCRSVLEASGYAP